MLVYLLRRVLISIPVLFAVLLASFLPHPNITTRPSLLTASILIHFADRISNVDKLNTINADLVRSTGMKGKLGATNSGTSAGLKKGTAPMQQSDCIIGVLRPELPKNTKPFLGLF